MISTQTLPGVRFESVGKRPAASPLRSDVAGFIGRARRGPLGQVVRVEGMREYEANFGGLSRNEPFAYALRAYFENGGQVAHVIRVNATDRRVAEADWIVGSRDPAAEPPLAIAVSGQFSVAKYRIRATSPGTWAVGLKVDIDYELNGLGNAPSITMIVQCAGEPTEYIRRLPLGQTRPGASLEELVAKQSRLIRLEPSLVQTDEITELDRTSHANGPQRWPWSLSLALPESPLSLPLTEVQLEEEYKAAIQLVGDQTEVAVMATPSIYSDMPSKEARLSIFQFMIHEAVDKQDRLVLIDAPPHGVVDSQALTANEMVTFTGELRGINTSPVSQRVAAVYHPWLRVEDPLGGAVQPLMTIPPSGHVAGVISRVDREQGAHFTPANVGVLNAVDVETQFDRHASEMMNQAGVNLIRCARGQGLIVWGGRTLDSAPEGRFIAHRRFIHRLIRAIRRVADPVVFDTNGPELWLILVRAISSVLLEAFRSGALQGARPEESFRVRCDERTSPMIDREQGKAYCEIDVALAAPMEFITIRVSVSADGQVEVFDT